MTKACAVPKCKTGYNSEKEKHSVFRVPRDPARLKKWEEAIPGNVKLKATHVICDKHFKERYIRREWIKYDPNDESKIIARAPYKYPQLSELAVPTRFDENLEDEKAADSIMKSVTPSLSCDKTVRIPLNSLVPLISDNVGYVSHVTEGPSVDGISTNRLSSHDNGEINVTMKLKADKSEDAGHLLVECASPINRSPDANDVSKDELLTFEQCKVDTSMEIPNKKKPIKKSSRMLNTNAKPYSVSSTVTINEKIEKANSTTEVKYSTDIPKSWSATELSDEGKQRIIFQYIVTKSDKGVKIPILQKCVALNSDGQLEYFVYGRLVETSDTILNRTLEEPTSLRKTLQIFRNMGICVGLGITSKDVPIEDGYVDYVQQWRHNDCTLISKYKRCANCTKLRNRIKSRIRNMQTRPTLKRIHQKTLNAFENRKVVALLKQRRKNIVTEKKLKDVPAV